MNKAGNRRWYGIMMLLWLPLATLAQDTLRTPQRHAFSLQQAIDYASKNNVQVKNALLDVQIQQQTNREVTGTAYPQISANGSLVYNAKLPVSLVPAEFFGGAPGTFEKLAFGVKWGATGGVSLNQILFDGQVFTGLQARKTLIDFQQKNVEVTEEMSEIVASRKRDNNSILISGRYSSSFTPCSRFSFTTRYRNTCWCSSNFRKAEG